MIAALGVAAAVALATPQPSLSDLAASATFHLYVLPQPAETDSITVLATDDQSRPTSVKIVYRLGDRLTVSIVETARATVQANDAAPSPAPAGKTYFVNGYPASYVLSGPYYQHVGTLTWLPPGVTVTISSMDMTDEPTLVNAALALY